MYNQLTRGCQTNSSITSYRRGSLLIGGSHEVQQKPKETTDNIGVITNTPDSKRLDELGRPVIKRGSFAYIAMVQAMTPRADRRALYGLPNEGD